MDYDDNDFQGQNLHLAGEGSSKFSPVLHPYALSKFDFDDGLQSHLRFDSLVENEVFLGIPSQEDNQWIEDFSRGSTAIEFSSSAAESCSISRHNNVWSEATSSESVEMLLKSVGQEEMVPGDTIIEESDACGELGGLTEGMEHHLKQEDEPKDAMDLEPGGAAVFSNPNVSSESRVIVGAEGVDRKCDDTSQAGVDNFVDDSHDNNLRKNSSGPGSQIDDIDSASHDIAAASVKFLKTQEPEHNVSEISIDNRNGLLLDTGKAAEEQQVLSKEADADDRILKGIEVSTGSHNLEDIHCPSGAKYVEQDMIESDISNIEETSSLSRKGESNPHIAEGFNGDMKSAEPEKASKCEPGDSSHGLEIHQQLRENVHEDLVVEGDSNIEGNAIEVITIEDGIPSSSEPKLDETTLGDSIVEGKANLQGSDKQSGSRASVSHSEASLMPVVDNKLFDSQGDGSSKYVGDFPSLTIACSSTELTGKHAVENLEGLGDASGVQKEDLNAEDCALSPIVAGSMQTYEGTIGSNSNKAQSNQDVSIKERENSELANDPSTMDSDIVESLSIVKSAESLSQGDDIKVNAALAHESECHTAAGNEPALNVGLEKTNSTLHDTEDGAALLCGTGATADNGSDHLDKSTKIRGEDAEDTSLLSLKEGLQGVSELCSALEVDKGLSQSYTGKLSPKDFDQSRSTLETSHRGSGIEQFVKSVHETIGPSFPVVETCNKTSGTEPAVKANEISQTASYRLEVCLTLSDSTIKEGSSAEGLVPGNREEVAVQKNHEVAPSKVAGGDVSVDSVRPDFGTPTVSSFVLSQNEEKKEGVKEPMGGNVSLTEVSVQSPSHKVSGDNPAKDERVHPSAGLSEREAKKDGESVIQTSKVPMIVEGSPSTPTVVQMDPKMVSELSRGSSQAPDGEIASGGSKGTPERKTRRPPARGTRKETSRRGSHVKETTPGNVQYSGTISRGVVSIPTSNLPDLNTSAPPSVSFHQPFTDIQQVQLRAQIFVYGSLIQRTVPDEACMVSAFGASDVGRSVWEPVWRSCMERIQGQKSHTNKSETPVQPRSGARPPDKPIKRGVHQSKLAPSPLGQTSSKGTPSPLSNSMIPLSSPLWNISTPGDGLQSSGIPRTSVLDYQQTLPPMHTLQTPPTRGFVGHNWLSPTHFPGPWVASPQTSAFDANARLSVSSITETVKLTPVKESSGLVTPEAKHACPVTLVHSSGPSVAETPFLSDMKKTTVLPTLNSTGPKARKRKKVNVFEDLGRISLLAQAQTESVSAPVISSHLSTSVVVSTPNFFSSKADTSKLAMSVVPSSSTDHPKTVEPNPKQNIMSEDTLSKVEEAKRQAEEAETLAAAAVGHSLSVWSQLDKHKNSGLSPDVEGKLAAAAVAVAAAASVAKAAAAAAKIASNAAIQAKMMADEALASGRTSNPALSSESSLYAVNNFGGASPASILMGGNVSTSSSSMLAAAREAARKRVEAASAASKQAENLDAILKAAELAAEAVSQAGKIVAMGDPLPLSELVKAGPEGYWRVPQLPPEQGVISNNGDRERSKAHSSENCPNVAKEGPSEEAKIVNPGLSPLPGDFPKESMEHHVRAADGLSSSFTTRETDSRAKRSRRALDVAKTIGVVPESEVESRAASITAQDEYEKVGGTVEESSMKEGCLVEVRKDGDGFKTAWFSANVLSLKDRKALVSYTELQSDEGSGKLREWVALEGEANTAPRIRVAHHITTMQFEGTRKRRRAAMGDYQWLIGDRVDVWMQDCWREGILTEKNKKDETILTVHFPAEGETSVVKAWHLRPTLIWKDGVWVEWSRSREKDPSTQGDTPREKRLKLGIPAIENREKDKQSKNIEFGESEKPDESLLLPLSANEKAFNIGKNIGDQNKPSALRTLRTGLQKEGSRVVFGVPKPGKKRKFIEVSKHYVAEKSSKTNESNDSVKFEKYLMPQGSGPRGWKNTKIVAKEKQATESKTKVLNSGKSLSVFGRTLPQKDKVSAQNDGPAVDHMIQDSGSTDENVSRKQSLMEFGSFSKPEGSAEGPVLFSSLALPSDAPSKKTSTSNARSERGNGRKLAHSSGKLATSEVDKRDDGNPGKSISEAAEPRRSNRRIQPTSRLLEGLQSSLVIPKFPAVSHDKSHRSQNRGGTYSKGNNHG